MIFPSLSECDEDAIIGCLSEGLGVEDIAQKRSLDLDLVRAFVFALPPDVLGEIYRKDETPMDEAQA